MKSIRLKAVPEYHIYAYASYLDIHNGIYLTFESHLVTYHTQTLMHIHPINKYAEVESLNYIPHSGVITKCKQS